MCLCLFVQFRNDSADAVVDFLVAHNFFSRVYELDVHAFLNVKVVLESSPAFTDTAFQEISFNRSFE